MANSPAICGKCQAELRLGALNTGQAASCPSCYENSYGYVYPAWFAKSQSAFRLEKAEEDEANCFFHEQSRASAECASCGKLVCSVCDIQISGLAHCPECVGKGRTKGSSLQTEAKRYDRAALLLSLLPLTLFGLYTSFITAPLALYFVFKYWSNRETIAPFNRWRFVVAALLSIATIAGWGIAIYAIVNSET